VGLAAAALALVVDAALARTRFVRRGLRLGLLKALASRVRAAASLGYYLGYHAIRYYGWPLLIASLLVPRVGVVAFAVLLGVAAVDHRVRRVTLGFPIFLFFHAGEQLSYGAGVFWGCVRYGSFRSYRPEVRGRAEMSFT